jgi:hypothetical protein
MSKKISHEEALNKYNHELESRELHKKGIRAKTSRAEKKKAKRESKANQFIEMLKGRGGLFTQKQKG